MAEAQATTKVFGMIKDTVTRLAQANPMAAFAWAGFCVITPVSLEALSPELDIGLIAPAIRPND